MIISSLLALIRMRIQLDMQPWVQKPAHCGTPFHFLNNSSPYGKNESWQRLLNSSRRRVAEK